MGKINDMVKDAHETAVQHGWWDKPPEFGTLIALCHSELSEALEEYQPRHITERMESQRESHQSWQIQSSVLWICADITELIWKQCWWKKQNLTKADHTDMGERKSK